MFENDRLHVPALTLAALALSSACGGSEPAPVVSPLPTATALPPPPAAPTVQMAAEPTFAVCDRGAIESCEERKVAAEDAAEVCKAAGGTFAAKGRCPRENVLGSCQKASGDSFHFYVGNGSNLSSTDAKAWCESNEADKGTWTEGAQGASHRSRVALPPERVYSSCAHAPLASCEERTVPDMSGDGVTERMCKSSSGKFTAKTPCPSLPLVGTCVYSSGRTTRQYVPTAGSQVGVAYAVFKEQCEKELPLQPGSGGYWIEGPEFSKPPPPASRKKPAAPPRKKK